MFSTLYRSLSRLPRYSPVAGAVAAGLAAVLAAPAAHAADYAIVCGVNQYPGLRPGSNLNGCDGDARLFASRLPAYGFSSSNIVILTDAEASHDAILAAIHSLSTRVTNRDRVVFYFAGHGTVGSSGDSVILPGDARDGSEDHDIQTTELYEAVKALPSGSKTIVLDSCHSGGMVRDLKGLKSFKNRVPRFYVRTKKRGTKEWKEVETNGADDLKKQLPPDGSICYFTAALKTQVAAETQLGGETHGVFTYSLARNMTGKRSLWQDLSATVSRDVSDATEGEQKPLLYPTDYLQRVAFDQPGGSEPTPPQPQPLTLEKLYALSAPDPSKISLVFRPATSPVVVNQTQIRFDISVGASGYLIVIGRDPKGKLTLLFPRGANAEISAAQVTAGSNIGVPKKPSGSFVNDAVGTDSVKAMLFTAPDAARKFMRTFSRGAIRQSKMGIREWVEPADRTNPGVNYATSEVITQIVDANTGSANTGSAAPGVAAP